MAVVLIGDAVLLVGGAVAVDLDCCCESPSFCPGTCTTCPATYSVTLTVAAPWSDLNGTYTLTLEAGTCVWFYETTIGGYILGIQIACAQGVWRVNVYYLGNVLTGLFELGSGGDCPPTASVSGDLYYGSTAYAATVTVSGLEGRRGLRQTHAVPEPERRRAICRACPERRKAVGTFGATFGPNLGNNAGGSLPLNATPPISVTAQSASGIPHRHPPSWTLSGDRNT